METPIHLVLFTPEIPANTGNIVRLCAATGISLHLVEPLGFSMDNRMLKRAGLDYWDRCTIHRHIQFEDLIQSAPEANFHFFTTRANRSYYDVRISPGDFLVLGPESTGLPKAFLDRDNRWQNACRIPMPGKIRCLNLATTAGIVVYESLRQMGMFSDNTGASQCLR